MDAGSVTNFAHQAFTISGIDGTEPWAISEMGTSDQAANGNTDYELHVTYGGGADQTWHLTGSLTEGQGANVWTGDGGVVLHLTATSVEQYVYGHFLAKGVHGSFDMDQPIVIHARF